jgi:hypothetical protein
VTVGPAPPYSPDRRTAVVLCGVGTHGAYHAGVLRALHDAGVRIDLMAGQGIGAVGAVLAAIDGAGRLWESGGLWSDPAPARFYGWKAPIRQAAWLIVALAAVLFVPAIVVVAGFLVHLVGFLLGMFGAEAGAVIGEASAGWMARLFAPGALPALLPAVAVVLVTLTAVVLVAGATAEWWRAPRRRAQSGWWRVVSAPIEADALRARVLRTLGDLLQGEGDSDPAALGRRYADVLIEGLGQPGIRELVVVATDLDARRDVVGVLTGASYREHLFSAPVEEDVGLDLVDLGGQPEMVMDLLAAAVTPPLGCDPHFVTWAPGSFWRGETHRLCDRPAAVHRLFDTVAAAGVTQVVVVSAVPPGAAPHQLQPPRLDLRSRIGEVLAVETAVALHDALAIARLRFDAVYAIAPDHNPVGPFDLRGAWDQASDRWQGIDELVARGAEDAADQFVGPFVGASGEQFAAADVHP